jgi:lauroyl/myristoyl acyltransferase
MSDATTAVRPSLRDPRNWPMFAAMLGAFAIARLPWMLQRALGRGVGWITWRLLGSRRRAAEVNLQLCFPEKDEAWRQRLVRDSFDALGWACSSASAPGGAASTASARRCRSKDWNICGRCRRKVVACCWCPATS